MCLNVVNLQIAPEGKKSRDEGMFQKLRKWKLIKKSLSAVDCILSIIENLIVPSSK